MNSYYWYLILDKNYKVCEICKKKGLIFDKYDFLSDDVSPKMVKIIKKYLGKCPANRTYIIAYKENDNTFSIVKCVGMLDYEETDTGIRYVTNICGEVFFHECEKYGLPVPEHHLGDFVFRTLKENIESGKLVLDGNFYKVADCDVYVYPLKALS